MSGDIAAQAGRHLINIPCTAHTYGLSNILVLRIDNHRFVETKTMPVSQANYTCFSLAEFSINGMTGSEVAALDQPLGYLFGHGHSFLEELDLREATLTESQLERVVAARFFPGCPQGENHSTSVSRHPPMLLTADLEY